MAATGFQTSLPNHGVPSFISDLASSPPSILIGRSVRVVGRVEHYDAPSNQAILSEPSNRPGTLLVDASLTDSDTFRPGSLVMLIGELAENSEPSKFHREREVSGSRTHVLQSTECDILNTTTKEGVKTNVSPAVCQNSVVLTARVATCVDRLDYTLYCQAVQVWRDLGISGS